MYTIFKNDIVIFLTDTLENKNNPGFFYWDKINFDLLFQRLEKEGENEIFLYHPDAELLWNNFQKKFKVMIAAGGVVQNSKKELLFIFRHEKWDLPKGKVEVGEDIADAALREVQEECGMNQLKIKTFIGNTYHIYTEKKREILKITHWFSMFSDEVNLQPQEEEGISIVVWKDRKEVKSALKNTFPNIKLLLENFLHNHDEKWKRH